MTLSKDKVQEEEEEVTVDFEGKQSFPGYKKQEGMVEQVEHSLKGNCFAFDFKDGQDKDAKIDYSWLVKKDHLLTCFDLYIPTEEQEVEEVIESYFFFDCLE